MPYDRNSELPESVRNALPSEAQTVWREVFNERLAAGDSEEVARRKAWAAVKNGWKKPEGGGQWVKKRDSLGVFIDRLESLVAELKADTLGRNQGDQAGAGPGGSCVCPNCDHRVAHETGVDCRDIECPECGVAMTREVEPKHAEPGEFFKQDDERQIVYGIVYEPEVEDTQGDAATAEEIEGAAHRFMVTKHKIRVDHESDLKASVVESYVAPVDFEMNGVLVPQGSWVMATKVHDPVEWQRVKDGELTGYSMGARFLRQEASE